MYLNVFSIFILLSLFTASPLVFGQDGNAVLTKCADEGMTYDKTKCREANIGKILNFKASVFDVKSATTITMKISHGNYADVVFRSKVGDIVKKEQILNFRGRLSRVGTGILVNHDIEDAVLESPENTEIVKAQTRFVISKDEMTIQDKDTGLIWQRKVSVHGFTWDGAFSSCKSLKLAGYTNDWRLPALEELQSLIFTPKKPSLMYIDPVAFPLTPSAFFWSASANDTKVAAVFFDMTKFPTGVGQNGSLGHVRCVRGKFADTYTVPANASSNLMTVPRPNSD